MPRFKILVPIKRVLDYVVKVRIKPDGSGFDLKNVKMSMNPFCEIAVEEAVRMRERELADEVVAVSVGPKKTIDTLRVALAIGADRAIQIVVPDDMPELQPLSVAQVLQLLVEREQPRLVLLGKQSIDGDNNQTGQMLAGMLDWPQGTFASKIERRDSDDESIFVTREVDGGLEDVNLRLPAVVTCDLRLNEPRFVKLANVMKAKKKEVETIDVTSLDVDVSPRVEILRVQEPPKRSGGVILPNVDSLVAELKSKTDVL